MERRCPECASGDLDLGESGSGRWPVTWSKIPCPGGGGLSFTLQVRPPLQRGAILPQYIEQFRIVVSKCFGCSPQNVSVIALRRRPVCAS